MKRIVDNSESSLQIPHASAPFASGEHIAQDVSASQLTESPHGSDKIVEQTERELLELSQQLLNSIDQQDWVAYTRLCDPQLTAFEPESCGNVIQGLPFHKFFFDMESPSRPKLSTISSPLIRVIGDAAVITYVRVSQRIAADGSVPISAFEETRIWEKQNGEWKHIHFHRSAPGTAS